MDPKREFLRHCVATVAYRGGKAIRGAPPSFATYGAPDTARTPAKILAHVGDLYDWALTQARGAEKWNDSGPLDWDREVDRFFDTLGRFDAYLASDAPLVATPERLFQGAIADSLTHVGQLAMLRRQAGCAIRGENYSKAAIAVGHIGKEQEAPKREFD